MKEKNHDRKEVLPRPPKGFVPTHAREFLHHGGRGCDIWKGEFNPDSAVAIDKKREAQPFRSEVDGPLPPSKVAISCAMSGVLNDSGRSAEYQKRV